MFSPAIIFKMEQFDELEERVMLSPVGRKRKRDLNNNKRAREKKFRHSGGGTIPSVNCKHENVVNVCLANRLSSDDIAHCNNQLYAVHDKVKQDATLLSYLDIEKPRRIRVPDNARKCNRGMTVRYFLLNKEKEKIQVCRATFCSVLGK